MALVRTQCPQCGTVEVGCAEVTVLRRTWDDSIDYEFPCPRCAEHVRRPLNAKHLDTLIEQGAHVTDLDDSSGSPLGLAEVLAFGRKLAQPGVLESELARLCG